MITIRIGTAIIIGLLIFVAGFALAVFSDFDYDIVMGDDDE